MLDLMDHPVAVPTNRFQVIDFVGAAMRTITFVMDMDGTPDTASRTAAPELFENLPGMEPVYVLHQTFQRKVPSQITGLHD